MHNRWFHLSLENCHERVALIIASLRGYDATYAQNMYARKTYYPESLRFGHRFVDVVRPLDDGRMLLDYDRFHDTVPDLREDAESE